MYPGHFETVYVRLGQVRTVYVRSRVGGGGMGSEKVCAMLSQRLSHSKDT